jgi:hypothetical protein
MATFNKVEDFVNQLCQGTHDLTTAGCTINAYLTAATPSASADSVKADLAEIATGNGYSGPQDTTNTGSETSGTFTVGGTDIVISATGAVTPFRYVPIYNDTPTTPADPLIGWWDYGSTVSLASGETFTIDFGASLLTIA